MADALTNKQRYMRRWHRTAKAPATPSQRPSRYAPSSNVGQPDIAAQLDLQGRFPIGFARTNGEISTSFDARPIAGIDFVKTITASELAAAVGQTQAFVFYTVPAGKIAIVRRIVSRAYAVEANPRSATTGAPLAALRLDVFVDNNAITQFNPTPLGGPGVRIDEAIVTPTFNDTSADIQTYIIMDEGSILQLRYVWENAFTFASLQPMIYGNLLMKKGVDLLSEPSATPPV